jgi:hypothetical protein
MINVALVGDAEARTARDIVARQMNPDQLAEAQKLAHEWKSARQELPEKKRTIRR